MSNQPIEEPTMTTPSGSGATLKEGKPDPEEQFITRMATSVIGTMNTKKKDRTKVAVPEYFEGDHKDTQHFMLDVELYLWMNKMKYNTNKKKIFLLSYVRGKVLRWKTGELLKLFSDKGEDDKYENKKPKKEESWSNFKKHLNYLATSQCHWGCSIED
ncbi:hypothetical protein Moror_15825 [Moniliophthora roreri MCA 2997]|uniref:Uncharacterized protein n=2 Tax=Moniliophthora roreri TaxID=221103 RepID=V2WLL6_MONRO|nr:hypothetical protein Moror_15825 [Moniliophthora roreri MCA 2997]